MFFKLHKSDICISNFYGFIAFIQIMKKLHKACQGYEKWKAKNNPYWKPWVYPDQIDLPRVCMDDIQSLSSLQEEDAVDEMDMKEEDVSDDDNGEGP
jgi:hypothetical protein